MKKRSSTEASSMRKITSAVMEFVESNVSTIRINGKVFRVQPFADGAVSDTNFGFNDCKSQVILYDPRMGEDAIKETFLHEVIHVLDYDHQNHLKESQVHRLAAGIYGFLKDNPEVAKWIVTTKPSGR